MTADELMQRVRTAAFHEILAAGRPPITSLATATGTGEPDVRAAAGRLLAAGQARIGEHGNLTVAAGFPGRGWPPADSPLPWLHDRPAAPPGAGPYPDSRRRIR